MSPRVTTINYKRFETFLKKIGCEFVRQKGDHRIWRKKGLSRPIVIPAEKDLPIFIIRNNFTKRRYPGIIESKQKQIINVAN
ncbi:MAG: type II toxin-antitoxin system HicA family toxin, partial [Candidatus Omnitrophota bacterium]